jgi:hypothetical protein
MLKEHKISANQLLELGISKASMPQPHKLQATVDKASDRQAG